MILVELLQLLQNNLFDCLYVLSVQISLEDSLLQTSELVVCDSPIQVFVQDPEYPLNRLLELQRQVLAIEIIQRSKRIEHCPLSTIQDFLDIAIIISRTFKPHLHLPILPDQSFYYPLNTDILKFLINLKLLLIQFIPYQYDWNLNYKIITLFLIVDIIGSQ